MRVLVTRPEPGATQTAGKLRELGIEPVMLPLTEIIALKPDWPAGRFDAVLVTSANAFRAASALPELWRALPMHVVGKRTEAAVRASGFANIKSVVADINALLAALSGSCSRGSRFVYLCGRVRRPDLETGLETRGHIVVPVETYDTHSVSYMTDKFQKISGLEALDGVLVMSGEAGHALVPYLRNPNLNQIFEKTWFYCISGRVAEELEPLAPGRVLVSETPDESGVLRLVQASPNR